MHHSLSTALTPQGTPAYAERLVLRLSMVFTNERFWLIVLPLAALTLRLVLAWQPLETLVAKVIPDDSFYYFQVARNITAGNGSSLDGLNTTNGYHPLWMAALLPLTSLSQEAFVRAALTLGAVIDTATIVALWWALVPLTKRLAIKIIAVSFYAFNPAVVFAAVNGLESSISLFCLVVLFGLLLRSGQTSPKKYRFWTVMGLMSGLAVLARTDNGIIVLLILSFLGYRSGLRPMLLVGLISLGVTFPWFAWNLATFGTPLQVSAEAATYVSRTNFDPNNALSFTEVLGHSASITKGAFLDEIPRVYFFSKPLLGTVVGALITGTIVAAWRSRDTRRMLRQQLPVMAVLAVGVLSLVVIHAGARWFLRPWYFLAVVPIAALFIAMMLEAILTWLQALSATERALRGVAMLVLVGTLVLLPIGLVRAELDRWHNNPHVWQRDMLSAARWVRQETPEDSRFMGMNVGIFSYFSDRTVTNLDGIMNEHALEALRDRELLAYVEQEAPDFLVEYDVFLLGVFANYWGGDIESRLTLTAKFNRALLYRPYRVYRFTQTEDEEADSAEPSH